VLCLFGAGAAVLWFRRPAIDTLAPATSPQRQLGPKENLRKRVPQEPGSITNALEPVSADFQFVAKSARKALDGDGKAALKIVDVLVKCVPIKIQYRDKPDPQAAFENELAGKSLPQWIIDRMRTKFLECSDFIHGTPFAGLPDRPGGYESIRFWNDLAYQENNPVALAQHAAAQPGLITGTADSAKIEAAQSDINKSAATGDPEALFRVGFLLADSRVAQDPLNAFAVMIAACNLGYDCTTNNEFAFGACVAANLCPQGEIYTDKIRNAIGDTIYAKAYGRAQQFQDALARGDTNAVEQFVQLKGAPSAVPQ
jgi:TPR repeat protein